MPFRDIIGHERTKAILQAAILNDRVAHAYLFHGDDGIGKRSTALRFVQAINCDIEYGPEGPDACGDCRSCRQIEARTHPDLHVIEPDPDRATPQIKIEQIRELEPHVIYRPLIGRRKVCLIDEADRMTLAAANALLKTLEEPPAHSLFLLVTARPSALPLTVRSRCQGLRFATPAEAQVEAALIQKRGLSPADARFLTLVTEAKIGHALGADLQEARATQQEFLLLASRETLGSIPQLLTVAEALAKSDRAPEALAWLARLVRELVVHRVGAGGDGRANGLLSDAVRRSAAGASVDVLLDVLEMIDAHQRAAHRNLNPQLALESVLLLLREALCANAVPGPTVRR